MNGRLAGKNAIITGGGAGLGFGMASLFGREGARIVILELDARLAARAELELCGEGIDAIAFTVDVADAHGVDRVFLEAARHFGGIVHILVNNAGIAEFGSAEGTPPELWERIMAVNVTGTFLCSRAVLPHMKPAGGAIVNLASIAGQVGIPKMAAYCASKGAVIALTRQMAVDYAARGIRVNCLCPGRVAGTLLDKNIMELDTAEETRAKIAKYPVGRFGRPEEIALAALFLASDEASFVTGTALTIDGGMTAL